LGQQQLLLIVLGVIIVGIAIVFAITMFRQGAIDSKRDLLINESSSLASHAMGYYKKPKMLGGGGSSFIGWVIPEDMKVTASGSFTATVSDDNVIITATGNEVVTGTDSIKVRVTVLSNSYTSEVIH
jgi:hypothetical protein